MLILKINVATPPILDQLLPSYKAILNNLGIQFDLLSR